MRNMKCGKLEQLRTSLHNAWLTT